MKKVFFALLFSIPLLLSCCSSSLPAGSSAADSTSASSVRTVSAAFPSWSPAWKTFVPSRPPRNNIENSAPASTSEAKITPEQFGAKGDGIANDLDALNAAAQQASQQGLPLELTAGATYRFCSNFELPSNLTLHGNGAVLLSDIQYETLWEDRPAVTITGASNTDRTHDVRLENIIFRAADTCQSNYQLRLMRARNIMITNCTFDCDINDWNRSVGDVYGANENITFQNDVFRQLSASEAGGLWVRSWTDQVESRAIRFLNCDFYKAGGDEVLAVWGWNGTVRDVLISGCNFYQIDEPKYRDRGFYPAWGITLGQSGETYVRMENCKVSFNRCETIFRMIGDGTHAIVDNCDISMEQPADFSQHDASTAANPMLARGNNRADGSTSFQNCRVFLSGDYGRKICYQVSLLRNNDFNVNLGVGAANTREIVGNTFLGTMQNGVFWDCDIVKGNTVIARTASTSWLTKGNGNFEEENAIQLDLVE